MKYWYVKDVSRVTRISGQTLHHYDRIGLLSPSIRQANGYRVYSEGDLLMLRKIIALKTFGFELSQIKTLLHEKNSILEALAVQANLLEQQGQTLLETSDQLQKVITDSKDHKSIQWENMINSIEVLRMKQELEKTWEGRALNPQELAEYAEFERDLKKRFSANDEKKMKQDWQDLVDQIHANLKTDPHSDIGIALGKRTMTWVNTLYGKKYIGLRNTVWEKGFKEGHAADEHGLSPEGVLWLDQAIDAYYRNSIYKILNQIDKKPHENLVKEWQDLLFDIYGQDQAQKTEFLDAVMQDRNIKQSAKEWARQNSH